MLNIPPCLLSSTLTSSKIPFTPTEHCLHGFILPLPYLLFYQHLLCPLCFSLHMIFVTIPGVNCLLSVSVSLRLTWTLCLPLGSRSFSCVLPSSQRSHPSSLQVSHWALTHAQGPVPNSTSRVFSGIPLTGQSDHHAYYFHVPVTTSVE